MKHPKIKRVLPTVMSIFFVFILGTSPVISEEATQKISIPSLTHKTSQQKSSGIKVIPIEPGEEIADWVARLELARVLSYVKRYDESIAAYKKVLQEKPSLIDVKIEMAKVLLWNGDQKAAFQVLEDVPPQEIKGDIQVLMADLFVAQKEYAKAERLYQAYLERHSEDHAVRLKLAEILSWQKKYEQSLAEFQKILEVQPNDIQVRRRYAFVLIWAGQHTKAASELKKTLD